MKNYERQKSAYIASLSKEQKAKFAFAPGPARDRCTDLGLWQGRTFNSPVKGAGESCTTSANHCTQEVLKSCFDSGESDCALKVKGVCADGG